MNLDQARLQLLTAPATAVWAGTVSSYDAASFFLTVTTVTGAFPTDISNLLLVRAGVDPVRVRLRSDQKLYLAENAVPFANGDMLALYDVRLPWPRYQRISSEMILKDFDIGFPTPWQAELPPTALLRARIGSSNDYAEAVYCAQNQTITLDASASYANLTTGAPLTFVWAPGAGGVITGSGATVTCVYSTAGFRYLKLTVTDAHGTWVTRYLPVWVGVPASAHPVTRCNARWDPRRGWTVDLEFAGAASVLQYSPAALVDIETREVLFVGFLALEQRELDFEREMTTATLHSALAFSQYLHAYPFLVTDLRGAETPEDWSQIYELHLARALWFLLYWHSTLPEIANCDLSAAPVRAIAGQEFTLGNLPQQVEALCRSAFWQVRGLRGGGLRVVADPLFLDTTAWAGLSAVDLSAATQLRETLRCEYAQPTVNQARLGGVYRAVGGSYEPALVQAPAAPGPWGNPAEVNGLAPASEAELQAWAGRYVGVENTADRYSVEPGASVDPGSTLAADLPGDVRVALERATLTFDVGTLRWKLELEGRTYGRTSGAVTLPQPPPIVYPPPDDPPLDPPYWDPLPVPEPIGWSQHLWVATKLGGVYETMNFTPPEDPQQPTWTAINTGLDSLKCLALRTSVLGAAGGYGYLLMEGAGNDASLRTVYRRGFWGTMWESLLTKAQAEAVLGASIYRMFNLDVDPVTGYVFVSVHELNAYQWHILRWDGSTWQKWCSSPVGDVRPSRRVPAILFVRGDTVLVANHEQYPVFGAWTGGYALSINAGVSWKYVTAGSFYVKPLLQRTSHAQPEVGYGVHDTAVDLRKVYDSGGSGLTLVVVGDAFDLGSDFGAHWISNVYPNWQRVIRDAELLETMDDWSSATVLATLDATYEQLLVLHEDLPEREDWMILGSDAPGSVRPHTIYALDLAQGTVVGKSGASPSVSPYTDSIPRTMGGIIFEGIRIIV